MTKLQDKIEEKNQNGEDRNKEPTDKLTHPPKGDRPKKVVKKPGHNSTAKDPTNRGQVT